MKCPVCNSEMKALLCGCGYDASRDYEKFPTFGAAGDALPPSALRARRNPKDALVCEKCGGTAFTIRIPDNTRRCSKCGWSPDEAPRLECSCGNRYFTVRLKDGMLMCPMCAKVIPMKDLLPREPAPATKPVKEAPKPLIPTVKETPKTTGQLSIPTPNPKEVLPKPNSVPSSSPSHRSPTIVDIASSRDHTVTLYSDGTVKAKGSNSYHKCAVFNWSAIIAIAVGENHTVGLRKDGTVVACGDNKNGQCNVNRWRDIISIRAGSYYTTGQNKDGRMLTTADRRF